MSLDRVTEICTLLLTQRIIAHHQVPEFEDEPELLEEARQRLEAVGLTLVQRTGIPYVAVVVRQEAMNDGIANELGLNRRALALILRVWLLLVAPHLYAGGPLPPNLRASTITLETLSLELQGQWSEQMLKMYLTRLVQAKFLEYVHGQARTYTAGPMLWLAIQHEVLIERLKRAAVPYTVARFREQQTRQKEGEEDE
jgi:hypothetical protein